MFPVPSRRRRGRHAIRRLTAVVALALGLVIPVVTPGTAHAADDWIVGTSQQSTILNCPSIVWGTPYPEPGIHAVNAYHGTLGTSPRVGQTSYMTTVLTRIGTHCDTPFAFPKFVLPSGVVFDTSEPIECYYKPPQGTQAPVTNGQECPQWSAIAADGRYTSTKSGWYGGWPLPSNTNGYNDSQWEFVVPIKATSVQNGSVIRSEVDVADGNDNPTLRPQVSFYAPTAPSGAPPGVPSLNSVQVFPSATSVSVGFTPPANDGGSAITAYRVECFSQDGGVTGSATGPSSPITVSGLTAGKRYSCRMQAQNSVGWGSWSAGSLSFPMVPPTPSAPGAPTDLVLTELELTKIRATFTPPASTGGSPISSYWVQCWQEGDNHVPAGSSEGPGTTHTVSDLIPGRRYNCRVKATNAAGVEGAWSGYSSIALGATPPGAPSGVTATATSATTAGVTFAAPAANGGDTITAYGTECVSSDGGASRTALSAASPATVSGLTPERQYRCQVRAQNSKGWGAWSGLSASFTTPAAPAGPGQPGDPGAPGAPGAPPAATPGSWTTLDESALKRKGRWKAVKGAGYHQGGARTAKRPGAALVTKGKVGAAGLELVATTCKRCGKVVVYYGKKRIAKISLKSASTRHGQVLPIRSWSATQKAKKIRIVVVGRKKVTIDALRIRTT
ncbi:fibronectin type III domain-containing protein [Nocardioides humi]|uniref:Fibronectin type-III domain-containing protein n=1 Tax=Nocardioides humi TaxID=449461 RepID=A0ABN1ZVL9_9ACTN|nr:fibronectin type III domain-containing protein [Nocardioides humi]